MNIYQRINTVMQAVKYVQKDAEIQGYKAVSHDKVVSVARDELVKAGIVIFPEQMDIGTVARTEGSKMHLYSALYRINFVNMDAPDDRIQVMIEAHAQDNGDKAPGKAVTYATKAAILKVLCLETGEGEESRTQEIDLAPELESFAKAETQAELLAVFKTAWKKYTGKDQRAALTAAKDAAKKRLEDSV